MRRFSFVITILKKDLLDSVKNKTVLFAVIFPIFLSLVFRVALNPKQLSGIKLGVVDLGNSRLVLFIEKFGLGSIKVEKVKNLNIGKEMVRRGKIQGVLVLPEDFDALLKKGKAPWVNLWVDETDLSKGAALEVFLEKILYHYNNQKPPVELFLNSVNGKNFNSKSAFLPMWILFTVLGSYMVTSSSILEEREKKTLQAILVTPCSITEILIGKGMAGFIITFVGSIIILLLNQGLIGNVLLNLMIILSGTLFFTILGIFIGLILPGHTSTNTFGSILYMVLFMPVVMAGTSNIMNIIARFLPSFYLLKGVKGAMFLNSGFSKLYPHICYLIFGSMLLFLGNAFILKRKESF